MSETKACSRCKEVKIISAFALKRRQNNTRHSHCRVCQSIARKVWWKSLPADRRAKEEQRARVHSNRIIENAPDVTVRRRQDLLRKFGLSLEQFLDMLQQQNNACAICTTKFENSTKANVDHNHATSKVRGLLCANCNRGLGLFTDSSQYLLNAAHYLTNNLETQQQGDVV